MSHELSEAEQVDIAIIGGGMVGLTLACALGGSGLQVVLIDPSELDAEQRWRQVEHAQQQGYDPRVSALSLASEQILRNLGAWQQMQCLRLSPYGQMQVWDGEGTAEIGFSAEQQHRTHLGHIVENRVTLAGLHRKFEQHDNLRWIGGVTLKALGPVTGESERSQRQISLSDGHRITAQLIVAADGARSMTRGLAGMALSEWDYQHQAIVTTVTTEHHHQHTAWQRFTEDGPLALLPLAGDGHQLSIVWSTSPDHARQLLAYDDDAFAQALERDFEKRLGTIQQVDPRFGFSLVQRHAQAYVTDGVALVGDAAHTIHPLAGQGVNLGLLDAATLAEEVLQSQQLGLGLGIKSRLRRYQRRRQGENLAMITAMAGFRHLYGDVPPLLHWLRNAGLKRVADTPWLKRKLVDHALGLDGDLPQLARAPIYDISSASV